MQHSKWMKARAITFHLTCLTTEQKYCLIELNHLRSHRHVVPSLDTNTMVGLSSILYRCPPTTCCNRTLHAQYTHSPNSTWKCSAIKMLKIRTTLRQFRRTPFSSLEWDGRVLMFTQKWQVASLLRYPHGFISSSGVASCRHGLDLLSSS